MKVKSSIRCGCVTISELETRDASGAYDASSFVIAAHSGMPCNSLFSFAETLGLCDDEVYSRRPECGL